MEISAGGPAVDSWDVANSVSAAEHSLVSAMVNNLGGGETSLDDQHEDLIWLLAKNLEKLARAEMRLSARYEHSLKYTELPKTKPGVWRFSHSVGEMPLVRTSPEAEEEWDRGSLPNTPERSSRIGACKSLPSFGSCSAIFANRFADYDSGSDDDMVPAPGSAAAAMYASRAEGAGGDGAAAVVDDSAEKARSLDEFDSPLIRRKCKSFSSFVDAANAAHDADEKIFIVNTPPREEKSHAAATASVDNTPPREEKLHAAATASVDTTPPREDKLYAAAIASVDNTPIRADKLYAAATASVDNTPIRADKLYAVATATAEETPIRAESCEKNQRTNSVRRSISFAMDEDEGGVQADVVLPFDPPSRSTSRSGLYGIRNGHTASVEIMSGPAGSVSTTSMFDEPQVVKSIVDLALTKLRAALSLYSMESLYFTTAKEFTSSEIMSMAAQHFKGSNADINNTSVCTGTGTGTGADADADADKAAGSASASGACNGNLDGDLGDDGDGEFSMSSVAEWLKHHEATNPLVAIPTKDRESELVTGHSSFLMRRRVVHMAYAEGAVGFGFGFTTCVVPGYPWTRVHRVTPSPEGTMARLMPGDVLVQVNGVDVLNNGPRFIGEQLAKSPPTLMMLVARSPDNESTGMYTTTTSSNLQSIGAVDEEIKGLYQVVPNNGAEDCIRQIMEGIEREYTKPIVNPANAWLSEQNEAIFSLLDSMSETLMETENVITEWDMQEEHHRYGPQIVDC